MRKERVAPARGGPLIAPRPRQMNAAHVVECRLLRPDIGAVTEAYRERLDARVESRFCGVAGRACVGDRCERFGSAGMTGTSARPVRDAWLCVGACRRFGDAANASIPNNIVSLRIAATSDIGKNDQAHANLQKFLATPRSWCSAFQIRGWPSFLANRKPNREGFATLACQRIE